MSPYTILTSGNADKGEAVSTRLISSQPLTDADFEQIARDLKSTKRFRARKVALVAAKVARERMLVETHVNGKETHTTAEPGDWIVTNMDKSRTILRDQQGQANTYVIRADKFPTLYEQDGDRNDFGELHRSKSPAVEMLSLNGGFDIVASWGERQQGSSGYLARNPILANDIYGINADAFENTYEVTV